MTTKRLEWNNVDDCVPEEDHDVLVYGKVNGCTHYEWGMAFYQDYEWHDTDITPEYWAYVDVPDEEGQD